MTKIGELIKRLFRPEAKLTQSEQAEAEREQRVAAREPVDYSYTVFWLKQARRWDIQRQSDLAQRLAVLLKSPAFEANLFDRTYALDGLDGAHSGASLKALEKVLEALRDESG
jgi:hypothetical protein